MLLCKHVYLCVFGKKDKPQILGLVSAMCLHSYSYFCGDPAFVYEIRVRLDVLLWTCDSFFLPCLLLCVCVRARIFYDVEHLCVFSLNLMSK